MSARMTSDLGRAAHDAFMRVWQRHSAGCECPVLSAHAGVTEELACLLAEAPDRPAAALAPRLRQLLQQWYFADNNGDSVLDPDLPGKLDREVADIVDALEQVRRSVLAETAWQHMPVTPQMFG